MLDPEIIRFRGNLFFCNLAELMLGRWLTCSCCALHWVEPSRTGLGHHSLSLVQHLAVHFNLRFHLMGCNFSKVHCYLGWDVKTTTKLPSVPQNGKSPFSGQALVVYGLCSLFCLTCLLDNNSGEQFLRIFHCVSRAQNRAGCRADHARNLTWEGKFPRSVTVGLHAHWLALASTILQTNHSIFHWAEAQTGEMIHGQLIRQVTMAVLTQFVICSNVFLLFIIEIHTDAAATWFRFQ